jgi:heme/copper-type cytochrome/quinol oxidase subunit 1
MVASTLADPILFEAVRSFSMERRGGTMQWIRSNPLVAAGLGLAVVGLVLMGIAVTATPPATFGWFAYAPPGSHSEFRVGPTAGEIFGTSLAGLGLVLIAGALGYLRGRSRG